jgi:beta-lactam-binding protein with PASTA domain
VLRTIQPPKTKEPRRIVQRAAKRRGPDHPAREKQDGYEVPDVSDLGVVKAARILSRAGFEVAATKSVSSQREIGTVLRTKPSAGSVVEQETPVVIVTSGGRPGSHQESGAETPVTARALSTQTEAPVRILRWSSGLRGA